MSEMSSNLIANVAMTADMQADPFLMVGGFAILAWVLARRKIRTGKRVNKDTRAGNKIVMRCVTTKNHRFRRATRHQKLNDGKQPCLICSVN